MEIWEMPEIRCNAYMRSQSNSELSDEQKSIIVVSVCLITLGIILSI